MIAAQPSTTQAVYLLVVEDNDLVAELVRATFAQAGWLVDIAGSGAAALNLLECRKYDVAILDVALPDADGYSVLRRIREFATYLPTIMLTARGGADNVIAGLDAGADDYLIKPFDPGELLARVQAIVRRVSTKAASQITFGDLSFDRLTREARCHGKRIGLAPKEQALLEQLMLRGNEGVSREELLKAVWRITFDPKSNLIDASATRLRAKLRRIGSRVVIRSERGAGLRLEIEGQ